MLSLEPCSAQVTVFMTVGCLILRDPLSSYKQGRNGMLECVSNYWMCWSFYLLCWAFLQCTNKYILFYFIFFYSTLALTKVARLLYFLICDLNCFQLSIFFGISDTTIAKYKSLLLICYKAILKKGLLC